MACVRYDSGENSCVEWIRQRRTRWWFPSALCLLFVRACACALLACVRAYVCNACETPTYISLLHTCVCVCNITPLPPPAQPLCHSTRLPPSVPLYAFAFIAAATVTHRFPSTLHSPRTTTAMRTHSMKANL